MINYFNKTLPSLFGNQNTGAFPAAPPPLFS